MTVTYDPLYRLALTQQKESHPKTPCNQLHHRDHPSRWNGDLIPHGPTTTYVPSPGHHSDARMEKTFLFSRVHASMSEIRNAWQMGRRETTTYHHLVDGFDNVVHFVPRDEAVIVHVV